MLNPDLMIFKRPIVLLPFIVIAFISFTACNKQEKVWQFQLSPPSPEPPLATVTDTVISVTALLNGDTLKALGRAEPPKEKMLIRFSDINSTGYLDVVLGADTPGVYHMGRSISANTAVWYNEEHVSFTSRATDDAGGNMTITEIDTVNHRIKGIFELNLSSRADSNEYRFDSGVFDILYNHIAVNLDDRQLEGTIDATVKKFALSSGDIAAPVPNILALIDDSLRLNMTIHYAGPGTYDLKDPERAGCSVEDIQSGKIYTATDGEVNLIRFNYGQFIQMLFSVTVKTEAGEELIFKSGSIVIGG